MSTDSPPISVQLYSLREEAANDFEGVLRRIGEIGFVGVELAGFHGLTPKQFAAIADGGGSRGVERSRADSVAGRPQRCARRPPGDRVRRRRVRVHAA